MDRLVGGRGESEGIGGIGGAGGTGTGGSGVSDGGGSAGLRLVAAIVAATPPGLAAIHGGAATSSTGVSRSSGPSGLPSRTPARSRSMPR